MITLKLTIEVDNPIGVATLQKRLEEVVRLLPHQYEVYQDSGAVAMNPDTVLLTIKATGPWQLEVTSR